MHVNSERCKCNSQFTLQFMQKQDYSSAAEIPHPLTSSLIAMYCKGGNSVDKKQMPNYTMAKQLQICHNISKFAQKTS